MFASRKAQFSFPLVIPTLIIVGIIFFGLIILYLGNILGATIRLEDNGVKANTALYTMLGSNDCTPKTKLAFKDLLAIGIAEGKMAITDKINLNYSGAEETVTFPNGQVVPYVYTDYCMKIFRDASVLPQSYLFYIEYAGKRYFEEQGVPNMAESVFKILSEEYVALPNGDVAKVVLKT